MKANRYRLHWSAGHAPRPELKWTVYDWSKGMCCPVAYATTRKQGRALLKFFQEYSE